MASQRIFLILFLCISICQFVYATDEFTFYKRAFQCNPTPTILLDQNYNIVEVSDSYLKILKLTRAECLTLNAIDLIRERLLPEEADKMINALQASSIDIRESRAVEIRDRRGQHFWKCHTRPWPHPFSDNELNTVQKFREFLKGGGKGQQKEPDGRFFITLQVTDLTDLVSHNSRMHENAVAADIYHLIVSNIEDYAIFMLATDGKVQTWNKGAQRMMQYDEEEVIGNHFGMFFKTDDQLDGEPEKELEGALSGTQRHFDDWRVKKDGEIFLCSISIQPIFRDDGTHLGFVKVTRDLTNRKKAETAMLEAYEQAAHLKQDFIAVASHEIMSPLTGVLACIELLLLTNPTGDQKDLMDRMKGAGERLLQIVQDLLTYSKLDARAVSLSSSNIVIRDMLRHLVQQYRAKAAVPIYLRVSEDVPSVVVSDSSRLQQVISNLVDNAVKFTAEGSIEVSVHVRRRSSVTSSSDRSGCSLLVRIKDTGIGLTSEQIDRLFVPFSQADPTIARDYGGTGLGLSICKQCVELMKGRIWVESEKGKGSTFSFTMDLETGEKSPLEETPVVTEAVEEMIQSLPKKPVKIVVVDDNDSVRRIVVRLLYLAGLVTTDFTDGTYVVDYFRKLSDTTPYANDHIVLMDVEMPLMNGIDATRAIHNLPQMERVPIIGVTANALLSDQNECFEAGMTGFISKPFKREQLLSRIHEEQIRLAQLQAAIMLTHSSPSSHHRLSSTTSSSKRSN